MASTEILSSSEYAEAGVDYTKIEPFKRAMVEVGKKTLTFPEHRLVFVDPHDHGSTYEYRGHYPHAWAKTQEGLGNKNWIAEWMYQFAGTGCTYYEGIGIDTALMAVNDLIACGAMPVIYTDEVAAGDSDWFKDEKRAKVLAESFYQVCKMTGMALPAGESPALRYLVKAEPPVKSAPSLSGCVTGIIAPKKRRITGSIKAGDHILGVTSSGIHANGISLIIKRALTLPDQFLTKLNGHTLGEEALIPTRSYVSLVKALLDEEIDIHAFLPGTGSGLSKIAFDKRPFTYRIHSWVNVPPLFKFMRELGVSLEDCLTTFNWGIGYYVFASPNVVPEVLFIGERAGYEVHDLGVVFEGERKVVFGPEKITLPPPGEN
ncbi:MAG: phosphoribosylformylglycinamidine cyclo-ligase [Parcubacteria group bacterium Gr01-1014_20]|nr:MAG: phosphoribosylformylglycinamidine cyclo-ligase [Parcubacteria group bacterium Gr01-1014_20]